MAVLDNPEFRNLLAYGNRFEIPSRNKLSRTLIPDSADAIRQQIVSALAVSNGISISIDLWSSSSMEHHLGCAAHWVSEEWKLKTAFLGIFPVVGHARSPILAKHLSTLLGDFSVDVQRVFAICTDGGSNIRDLNWDIQDGRHIHQERCNAHVLNNILEVLFLKDPWKSLISKCRKVVTKFHSSTIAMDKLRENMEKENFAFTSLVGYVDTRWNSVLGMIRRISTVRASLMSAIIQLNWTRDIEVSPSDFSLMEQMIPILEPFELLSNLFSEKDSPVLSLSHSMFRWLIEKCTPSESDNDECMELKHSLMERIQKYWGNGLLS